MVHNEFIAKALLYLAIICSMLSQIPSFLESGVDSVLKLSWLLPLSYLLWNHFRSFTSKQLFPFYALLVVFFLYCYTCEGVFGIPYVGSDLYNMAISCMVTIVGYSYWQNYSNEKTLLQLAIILLICGCILAFIVYTDFLADVSLLQRKYAFGNKNSMGQILLASALIGVTQLPNMSKKAKLFTLASATLILIVMMMIKSRATIAAFFFVVAYYIIKYNNMKVRMFSFLITAAIVIYILTDETAYNLIVNGILLGGRNAHNIDDVSSGRISLLQDLLRITEGHWTFGIGQKYFDCFPIIITAQYGIVGASVVFSFILYIFHYTIFKINQNNTIHLAAFLLFISFMINSLFEAQTPFGPGIKCFLLWLMFGISLAEYKRQVAIASTPTDEEEEEAPTLSDHNHQPIIS